MSWEGISLNMTDTNQRASRAYDTANDLSRQHYSLSEATHSPGKSMSVMSISTPYNAEGFTLSSDIRALNYFEFMATPLVAMGPPHQAAHVQRPDTIDVAQKQQSKGQYSGYC